MTIGKNFNIDIFEMMVIAALILGIVKILHG